MAESEHSRRPESPGNGFVWLAAGAAVAAAAWEIAAHAASWKTVELFCLVQLRSAAVTALVPALALLAGYAVLSPARARWGPSGKPSSLTLSPADSRGGSPARPSLTLSLALGWGLVSLYVWALAGIGSLTGWNLFWKWMPWATIAACAILLRRRAMELAADLRERAWLLRLTLASWTGGWERWLLPVAAVVFGLVLLQLFLAALTPSFLYDVLEYHLPAVRALLERGSLAPPEGNAYLKMPQAVEALYAFAALLGGGDFAPKLIHLFLALSTLALLNVLLRELGATSPLRVLAALLLLAHPVSFKLLLDAYVDMGTALFVTAALVCWLRACRFPNRLDMPLAAVFLGFAFSCKYPVLGVAILPFLLGLVPLAPPETLPVPSERLGKRSAVFLNVPILTLVAGLAYSPWLLRALIYEHSPFPPLTLPWFGADDPGARAIGACMARYHRPIPPWSAEYAGAVFRRLPNTVSPLLLFPPLVLALLPRVNRRRRGLALFVLLGCLVWCTGPHAQDRFLAPLLPALAALAALGVKEIRERSARAGVLLAVLFSGWAAWCAFGLVRDSHLIGIPEAGLGATSRFEFREKMMGGVTAEFFRAINASAARRPKPRVLLLYEARVAALDPGVEATANTVFDRCVLWELLRSEKGGDPRWVVGELRARGITHVAVNEVELARLLGTYPAHEARGDPGYRYAASRKFGGVFNPALLPYRRYYPPFYYFGEVGEHAETERRLDALLETVRAARPPVWESEVGGARLWVSELKE